MTLEQQDTGLAGSERAAEMAADRNEPTMGGTDSPVQKAKERCLSQRAEIDHNLSSVEKSIQDFERRIEGAAGMDKREDLRSKLRVFQQRREDLLADRVLIERQLAAIAQQEQKDRVKDTARTRGELQKDGQGVADTLRHTLGLLEAQFANWLELRDRERTAKDVLRSLAPQRMTDLPDFSYATTVDQNFQVALGQVIAECHRAQADLHARTHASEIQDANARALVEASEADLARRKAQNEELSKKATTPHRVL